MSIQGRYGILLRGLRPRRRVPGSRPNEITWKQDLVTWCRSEAAAVPGLYKPENKRRLATSFRQELTGNDIK